MASCRTSKGRFSCSSKNRAGSDERFYAQRVLCERGQSQDAGSPRELVPPAKPTRMEALEALLPPGYSVATYSPGDGQTRYRFFEKAPERQTYFGPASGIYTALGYKEAWVFAQGLAR